jgi:predicted DCC family thiol-disulfide oxidoreductase YuxK
MNFLASGTPIQPRWAVIYDADCGFCKWLLSALLRWDRAERLRPVALQRPEADDLLKELAPAERLSSWHLISPAGERHSGGAALSPLFRLLPAGRVAAAGFARSPRLTDRAYRWAAEHRSQLSRCVPPGAKERASRRVHEREHQPVPSRGSGGTSAPNRMGAVEREKLLRATYEAFNARDIDTVLRRMAADVDWPNAWEGGRVHGHADVRDYWTRQWSAIDPRVEPVGFAALADGRVALEVNQIVRGLDGSLLSEERLLHIYRFRGDLVARMDVEEISALPPQQRAGQSR